MRVFAAVLFAVSPALAYQVTYPGGSQGWNTTGPNSLGWERVDTDPLNFTVVLTNQNSGYDQVLDALVDGTLGHVVCSPPSGGWPTGSNFRVNLAQDSQHLDSLLAQSSEFNITAVTSTGSATSSASIQTVTSAATTTTPFIPGVSSSDTSTTPTGISAASLGADAQAGLLTVIAAMAASFTTLF